MPPTIFTLCDLSNFSEYGSNSTSVTMLSSQLLTLWARTYFYHINMLMETQIATFTILYGTVIKDSKPCEPLQVVVQLLKKELNKSLQVSIFKFAFFTSLSAVADAVRNGLATANAKIAANISLWVSNLLFDH